MIDSFYRIKSLHELGVHIHLHCFEYGRSHSDELASLCETISYYKRKSGIFKQFSFLPYTVLSRKSKVLLGKLKQNEYPILFDGLHSTYYLRHPSLSKRRKLVRTHNIEHRYYSSMAMFEKNIFRKLYYLIEAQKLKRYEKILMNASEVLSISASDEEYFNKKYRNSVLIGPSHPFGTVESITGSGKFILFHGDISISENEAIADSLITNIFSKVSYPCIIAGKNPSLKILSLASNYSNIRVISNPSIYEINQLIKNSHINVLPALVSNGFKLKLLFALYAGRHCLVNEVAVLGSSLIPLCNIAESWEDFILKINELMKEPFTEEMIVERKKVLSEDFDNLSNAKKITDLFSEG
jgi:hypothetical protein